MAGLVFTEGCEVVLYSLDWLQPGEVFPPASEVARLDRYRSNLRVFAGDGIALEEEYAPYISRIQTVITNFGEYYQFPVILNYQRLMTIKMADLVCGELPIITANSEERNATLLDIREDTQFDEKLYATVIDISRYGDAVWRIYKGENGKNNFTCWDPGMWFPIVSQDGTNRITHQVICWTVNRGTEEKPDWYLCAQVHEVGFYTYLELSIDHKTGVLGPVVESRVVPTGLKVNAVINLRAHATSDTVYGYDDYLAVDSILAELMVRIAQISTILDKHADPAMTGPVSMLKMDEETGRTYLETGKFYAVSPGEEQPKYLTWEGELGSSFKQIEMLLNQLYVLSEMGAAILGTADSGSQAVSGTAMRFKMVAPLAKARRISSSLSLPVRSLFAALSTIGYEPLDRKDISIEWEDGLPDDPRENAELAKLVSGAKKLMPLELAIVEYFKRTDKEAKRWIEMLKEQEPETGEDVNKPGPQDGTGVNPQRKGSETGLVGFHGLTNK